MKNKLKDPMETFIIQDLLYVDNDTSTKEMTFRATSTTDYNGFVAFERGEFNKKFKSDDHRKCGSSVHLMNKHVEIELVLESDIPLKTCDIQSYLLDVYIAVDGYCKQRRRLIYKILRIVAKPMDDLVIEEDDENEDILEEYEIKEIFNNMLKDAYSKLKIKKERLAKIETSLGEIKVSHEGIEALESIIKTLDKKSF